MRGLQAESWIILGVLFVARAAMAFQFQSIASTAPFLIHDLGLSYAQIGTLIGLYMFPGAVTSLPAGLFSRHLGDKVIGSTGLALMVVGGALAGISDGYGLAFAGRLISGVGAAVFSLVVTKMVTDWFAGRNIMSAMGIVLASWPFGIAVGLLVQAPIAAALGWPWVMHIAAGLCAVGMLLVLALYRSPPQAASEPGTSRSAAPGRFALPPKWETLSALVAGAIWGSFNIAMVLFFSFGPLMLIEHGARPVEAASWTSIALWICMFSVPLGSFAVQRSGRLISTTVFFCCLGGLALGLLPMGFVPAVLCAIVGIAIGPPVAALMALPAQALSQPNRAAGYGLFYTVHYVMSALGPALAGLLRDFWGTSTAAVLLGAASFVAVLPLLLLFKRVSAPSRWAAS
jgi:predicted MFS family arabinose efflux permease